MGFHHSGNFSSYKPYEGAKVQPIPAGTIFALECGKVDTGKAGKIDNLQGKH